MLVRQKFQKNFEKIRLKHKVCLLDLDFRKKRKRLTKDIGNNKRYSGYEDFLRDKEDFIFENDSIFIPALDGTS